MTQATPVSGPAPKIEHTAAPEVYSSHIADLMKSEFERRRRLELRGQSVMTTSTGLLTLFIAIATLMAHQNYHVTSCIAVKLICISFGIFVLAAALGIATQSAFTSYSATSTGTLDAMVDSHWDDDVDGPKGARWICAKRHIETIKSLRIQNARKARLALAGPIVQLFAITILAVAVVLEVVSKWGYSSL